MLEEVPGKTKRKVDYWSRPADWKYFVTFRHNKHRVAARRYFRTSPDTTTFASRCVAKIQTGILAFT
jgi:hypothetical protein